GHILSHPPPLPKRRNAELQQHHGSSRHPIIARRKTPDARQARLRLAPYALRLLPFIQPCLGILHLASEPEPIYRVAPQGAPLLSVRLGCLPLIPNGGQPFQERCNLVIKHLLEILSEPAC